MKTSNKTLAVTIRFWTTNLKVSLHGKPEEACWDFGTAILEANKDRNISADQEMLHCPADIVPAIKKLFRRAGILMVSKNLKPRIK